MKEARVAELQYSKDYGRLELVVPHGTKVLELGKIVDLIAKNVLERLPRGCPACTSGDHLLIREQLEHVVRVDLDLGEILRP